MKIKNKALIAGAIALGLVTTTAVPANAWWFNTTRNVGTSSIQVRNISGDWFYLGAGNSAEDVNRVHPGYGKRAVVKILSGTGAGATWKSGCGVGIDVPGGGGVRSVQKVNC